MKRYMNKNEVLATLQWKIDDEGLDYAIRHQSSWSDITDAKFHELRVKYIEAAEAIEVWIAEQHEN